MHCRHCTQTEGFTVLNTDWDYTQLASSYLQRPDYSAAAVEALLSIAGIMPESKVCDIGAGSAHLTLVLAKQLCEVHAVEPNAAMSSLGRSRTKQLENVQWFVGTGEESGRPSRTYDLVSFGSSFNVCQPFEALRESSRLLKPGGWFACLWNNRDLSDPIQQEIEQLIHKHIPSYAYGTRRMDQTTVIDSSKMFGPVIHVSSKSMREQSIDSCVDAWRSHATLERQAGIKFPKIISEIELLLGEIPNETIQIPYTTNVWMAQATES